MTEPLRHPLSARFERFAREATTMGSTLYQQLSNHIAENEALLEIAANIPREPIPNTFFGAVHYLLLSGAKHPLRDYYPSLTPRPRIDDALFATFSDFCISSRDALMPLLTSRITQTNEVNRSAVLAPAFCVVAALAGNQPLTLIEVGASAGLNLFWDSYRIAYSDGTILGDPHSPVHVTCELRGAPLPAAIELPLTITGRIGIDLNPIDLSDPDARLWLQALVWPDHLERARRLEAAIQLAAARQPNLLRGDALELLPKVLQDLPPDGAPCVFHSAVLYQFTPEARERFFSQLAAASAELGRPIWHVYAENEENLKLFTYRDGRVDDEQTLANFDAHGRWLVWQPS
jgi:hypothetical protein